MSKKYILAIDHGTSGIKAAIISTHGEVVDFEFKATPIYFLPRGGAEQDPQDWWNALVHTSRILVQRGAVPAGDIVALCVSSTFSSTVAVDKNGMHLMNSLTWMDSRGAPYVQKLMRGFPNIEGYSARNLLRWIPRTAGGPGLSGKDDIAHVLLTKHEFPDVYEKTYLFLPSKDYLNLRLTGSFAASYDSMHLFWVTNIKDIDNPYYDDELIRVLGIKRDKLPPLKRSIDVLGQITAEFAALTGLNKDVKVVMGSADHQAALIGSGAVRDYEGHIYIGTSSWVQCVVPFKKTDLLHQIASLPSAIPCRFQSVNEQDIAGGCLNFFFDNILYFQKKLVSQSPSDNPFGDLDQIAAEVPAGSNNLIFTPWLNGERTPVDDTSIRAGFYNISNTTTINDLSRSMLEGVAYNTRWSFGYVEKFVGRKLNPLNIVGGGGKSALWCQIFADVLDRQIRQVKDPMQANARGAAFIAAVGLGEITFDDIPNLIQYESTFSPNPENREIYNRLFKEFLHIYKNNKAMYRRLNRVP